MKRLVKKLEKVDYEKIGGGNEHRKNTDYQDNLRCLLQTTNINNTKHDW